MGWTGLHRQPGLSDREFFEREFPIALGEHGQIVACATRPGMDGNRVFYAAVRNNPDAPHAPGQTWALVVLTHRSGGYHNFAYKEMGETMGPAEDDAPAAVLDALTPTDNQWANEWRGRCRANLARRAARPTVKRGDVVGFAQPLAFANGETLSELVFVERTTFTKPDSAVRYRVPRWREREHTVRKAAG